MGCGMLASAMCHRKLSIGPHSSTVAIFKCPPGTAASGRRDECGARRCGCVGKALSLRHEMEFMVNANHPETRRHFVQATFA